MLIPNPINIFISYATKDAEFFQVPKLAEILKGYSEIGEVYYWQEEASGSIIDYMEKHIIIADTCIFCYSKAALGSQAVKKERDMAIYSGKHIIPIFTDINDVPLSIRVEIGINIRNYGIKKTANEILRLILKNKSDSIRNSHLKISNDKSTKIVKNHKKHLIQNEYDVIIALEKFIGEIPIVSKVNYDTFGFLVHKYHVIQLNLYKKTLTSLPESIGNLKSLTNLNLWNNQLTSLPESIGNLTSLENLDLGNNQLTSLPESISNLKSLTNLNLKLNRLNDLPESIGNLTSLKNLDLKGNKLSSLPESICNLKSLTNLNMKMNQLTSLHDRIKRWIKYLKKHGCKVYE